MDEMVQEGYNRVKPTPREFTVVREDSKNKSVSSSVSRIPFQRSCSMPLSLRYSTFRKWRSLSNFGLHLHR